MTRLVPGIHLGCGLMPPTLTLVRDRKSEPSSATVTISCPLPGSSSSAAIVPCGGTLIPAEPEAPPAAPVTVYLPIADTLTNPALPTDTPGAVPEYVTGSVRGLPWASTATPRIVKLRPV